MRPDGFVELCTKGPFVLLLLSTRNFANMIDHLDSRPNSDELTMPGGLCRALIEYAYGKLFEQSAVLMLDGLETSGRSPRLSALSSAYGIVKSAAGHSLVRTFAKTGPSCACFLLKRRLSSLACLWECLDRGNTHNRIALICHCG